MGFGHRVYKNGDPRAKHLMKMSKELGERNNNLKWYDMSIKVEELVTRMKGLKPTWISIPLPCILAWKSPATCLR